jgi:serine/threonine protein kinase
MTSFLPPETQDLSGLVGLELRSEVAPEVVYRLQAIAGEGAMSVAFRGRRIAPDGTTAVVVKVLRPELVAQQGEVARLVVLKEAVALGRLNERVPPTPHVVRLVDTGSMRTEVGGQNADLSWIALEHVHGGVEGTTLTERVVHSIRTTGHAFDPYRAALLVDALGDGLTAVHEVGVIHRDMKPDNVLCCGFGDDEIFKIADFGVARPKGLGATFGLVVGTLAYAAPELTMGDDTVGPWSDVFGMAAILYFALTGQDYFDVSTPAKAVLAATSPARRSLTASPWLSPELGRRADACRAIDFAFACATSASVETRPGRADALASMITPWLRVAPPRPSTVGARRARLVSEPDDEVTKLVGWRWSALRRGAPLDRVVRDVAWDGDGRCMAATSRGLAFWNGAAWAEVPAGPSMDPARVRFVQRASPGHWLVADEQLTLALHTPAGPRPLAPLPPSELTFELLSGDLGRLAVLVGSAPGDDHLQIISLSQRVWSSPVALRGVAAVTSLTQVSPSSWLVAGRALDGGAYLASFNPHEATLHRHDAGDVRAILACAGQPSSSRGLAVGTDGAVLWVFPSGTHREVLPGAPAISRAAIDPAGRGVCAAAGHLWLHQRAAATLDPSVAPIGRWERLWSDPSWIAPFVALFTEPGRILAMTADGDVLEGRATRSAVGPAGAPASG